MAPCGFVMMGMADERRDGDSRSCAGIRGSCSLCDSNLWDLCCWGLKRDYQDTAEDAENCGKDSFVKFNQCKGDSRRCEKKAFSPTLP